MRISGNWTQLRKEFLLAKYHFVPAFSIAFALYSVVMLVNKLFSNAEAIRVISLNYFSLSENRAIEWIFYNIYEAQRYFLLLIIHSIMSCLTFTSFYLLFFCSNLLQFTLKSVIFYSPAGKRSISWKPSYDKKSEATFSLRQVRRIIGRRSG